MVHLASVSTVSACGRNEVRNWGTTTPWQHGPSVWCEKSGRTYRRDWGANTGMRLKESWSSCMLHLARTHGRKCTAGLPMTCWVLSGTSSRHSLKRLLLLMLYPAGILLTWNLETHTCGMNNTVCRILSCWALLLAKLHRSVWVLDPRSLPGVTSVWSRLGAILTWVSDPPRRDQSSTQQQELLKLLGVRTLNWPHYRDSQLSSPKHYPSPVCLSPATCTTFHNLCLMNIRHSIPGPI